MCAHDDDDLCFGFACHAPNVIKRRFVAPSHLNDVMNMRINVGHFGSRSLTKRCNGNSKPSTTVARIMPRSLLVETTGERDQASPDRTWDH